MDSPTDVLEPSWGVRINTSDTGALVAPCPAWASPAQQAVWAKPGLVFWDHAAQQTRYLTPVTALDWLARLRTTTAWQTDGVILGDPSFLLPEPPHPHPYRHSEAPSSEVLPPSPQLEILLRNSVQLTSTQACMLLQTLEAYEAALRALAEPTLRRQSEALGNAQRFFFSAMALKVAQNVDLSTRAFPWIHDPAQQTWTCDHASNRVTIRLADDEPWWRGCLEQPHRRKQNSPLFLAFEEILAWGEHALAQEVEAPVSNQPTPIARPQLSLDTLSAAQRKRLKRYWIGPQELEPSHPTYRTVIVLDHVPLHHAYQELSFGEKMVIDERYPEPTTLLRRLALSSQVIDQIDAFNRITSLATYADAATARERVTQLWERSSIATAFQAGDVTRAKYGIQEVETSYTWWLGGYGAWQTGTEDRSAFLARRAFQLTLMHALDSASYRAAMPIFGPEDTDMSVLQHMHEQRMASLHIPIEARSESAQWLREHPAAESKQNRPSTVPAQGKTKRRGAKATS